MSSWQTGITLNGYVVGGASDGSEIYIEEDFSGFDLLHDGCPLGEGLTEQEVEETLASLGANPASGWR